MAKKKNSPPGRRDPEDEADEDLVPAVPAAEESAEAEADAELAEALADLGDISGATVTVNRVNDQGKEELLDRFPAREFDLYSIRDRYGAGTYWFYGRDGRQLRKKGRVIFGRTLDEQRQASGRPGTSTLAAPADALRDLFDRLAQQNQENMKMMIQMITSQRTPATDPMMIIDAASKLANLNKRGNDGDSLEQQLRLHKFIRELAGEGASDPGLAGVAREAFSTLRELALTQKAPAPAIGQSTQSGDPSQMEAIIRRALMERLPVLIRGAQADTDVGVYAQLVLDQVPGLYLQALLSHLQKPDWFDVLVQLDGRVVPLQSWFQALRNEIVQATSPPDTPAA
jgi:hypothetical protein